MSQNLRSNFIPTVLQASIAVLQEATIASELSGAADSVAESRNHSKLELHATQH